MPSFMQAVKLGIAFGIGFSIASVLYEVASFFLLISYYALMPEVGGGLGM
jgi:hypothetical protein